MRRILRMESIRKIRSDGFIGLTHDTTDAGDARFGKKIDGHLPDPAAKDDVNTPSFEPGDQIAVARAVRFFDGGAFHRFAFDDIELKTRALAKVLKDFIGLVTHGNFHKR